MGRGRWPVSTLLRSRCSDSVRGSTSAAFAGTKSLEATRVPYTSTNDTMPVGPAAFRMRADCREALGPEAEANLPQRGTHEKELWVNKNSVISVGWRITERSCADTLLVGGLVSASSVAMSK